MVLFVLVGLLAIGTRYTATASDSLTYRLDVQVSTGLTAPGSMHAMTRIQADVAMILEESRIRLQLKKPRMAMSQKERNPKQLQPIDAYGDVIIDNAQIKDLSLPFEADYRNGLISEVVFEESDSIWSKNLKKAVLNLLQVNLKTRKNDGNDEDSMSFVLEEETLEGDCEVMYTKLEEVTADRWERWTKSLNFEKCSKRPIRVQSMNEVCDDCRNMMGDDKIAESTIEYNVSLDEGKIMVHSALARSQYLFSPLSPKVELFCSFSVSKLQLLDRYHAEVQTVESPRAGSLVYEWEPTEQWAATGNEEFLKEQWHHKVDQVKRLLTRLSHHLEDGADAEAAHVVARLVKVMRLSTNEELEKMKQFATGDNFSKKSANHVVDVFHQALAIAGTRASLNILYDSNSPKAAIWLKSLMDLAQPSREIIEDLGDFCGTDSLTNATRQSCWLSYGAVVGRLCRQPCGRPLRRELAGEMRNRVTGDKYNRILMLKTLANAGLVESAQDLADIFNDLNQDKSVRLEAIMAMRRISSSMEAQKALLPLYKNRQVSAHLRMAALEMMMNGQPNSAVLAQIVQQMGVEKSQHVKTFTYSIMKAMADGKSPCGKAFSARVQRQLAIQPARNIRAHESRYYRWGSFSNSHLTGSQAAITTIFSNASILPNQLTIGLDGVFAGDLNPLFLQLGFVQKNADKWIDRWMSSPRKSQVRGRRSDFMSMLLEKMQIQRRQSPDEPELMLFARLRDLDFGFVELKELSNIPELDMAAAGFLYESTKKIPTSSGLPIVMCAKSPSVAVLKGKLGAEIKATVSFSTSHVADLTVISPIVQAGARLIHELEIRLPMSMNLTSRSMDAPKEAFTMLHYASHPVLFTKKVSRDSRQYLEPVLTDLMVPTRRRELRRDYFNGTGMVMTVRGQTMPEVSPIVAENQVTVRIEPEMKTFKKLELDLSMTSNELSRIYQASLKSIGELEQTYLAHLNYTQAEMDMLKFKLKGTSWSMSAQSVMTWPSATQELKMDGRIAWGEKKKQTIEMKLDGTRTLVEPEVSTSRRSALSQHEKQQELARINKFDLQLDYELDKTTKVQMTRFLTALELLSQQFWYGEAKSAEHEKNRLRAKLTIGKMSYNMTVETPSEDVVYLDVPVVLPMELVQAKLTATCTVKEGLIRTFDRTEYSITLPECYSILAKDCASETPAFVVLMKKSDRKAMKILLDEIVVDLTVSDDGIVAHVNGEATKKNSMLSWVNPQLVVLEHDGLKVKFDGREARIEMSRRFAGRQCGLCGHFDGEKGNDLIAADNRQASLEKFIRSYVYDDNCSVKAADSEEYEEESDEDEEAEDEDELLKREDKETRPPVSRKIVMEFEGKICVSAAPEAECEKHFEPVVSRRKKVNFMCPSSRTNNEQLHQDNNVHQKILKLPISCRPVTVF